MKIQQQNVKEEDNRFHLTCVLSFKLNEYESTWSTPNTVSSLPTAPTSSSSWSLLPSSCFTDNLTRYFRPLTFMHKNIDLSVSFFLSLIVEFLCVSSKFDFFMSDALICDTFCIFANFILFFFLLNFTLHTHSRSGK